MSSHPANRYTGPLRACFRGLAPAWQAALKEPDSLASLQRLAPFLEERVAAGATIFPRDPFRALSLTPPESVRVIILGQDPYHGPNQAQGLSFSVPDACATPPSLRNIFKELARSYPDTPRRQGNDLSSWARQGVLLLNAVLTVEARQPASHANQGWEHVTDALIRYVAGLPQPKVFLLWGAHAQNKRTLLREVGGPHNHVLLANHPSPFSAERPPRPFIGCNHFIDANAWLAAQGQPTIDWLGTRADDDAPAAEDGPSASAASAASAAVAAADRTPAALATPPDMPPPASPPAPPSVPPPRPADVPPPPDLPEVTPTPDLPEVPGTPNGPEVPTFPPEEPEIQEVPDAPDIIEVPEVPEITEVPEAPEIPDTPDTPEIPEPPDGPDVPDAPEVPGIPPTPDGPGILVPPATPGNGAAVAPAAGLSPDGDGGDPPPDGPGPDGPGLDGPGPAWVQGTLW